MQCRPQQANIPLGEDGTDWPEITLDESFPSGLGQRLQQECSWPLCWICLRVPLPGPWNSQALNTILASLVTAPVLPENQWLNVLHVSNRDKKTGGWSTGLTPSFPAHRADALPATLAMGWVRLYQSEEGTPPCLFPAGTMSGETDARSSGLPHAPQVGSVPGSGPETSLVLPSVFHQ